MNEKQAIIIGHFREGKSIRQLAGELGRSREAIGNYVKAYSEKKTQLELVFQAAHQVKLQLISHLQEQQDMTS